MQTTTLTEDAIMADEVQIKRESETGLYIATNHSEALHIVGDLRYEYGFRHKDIPGQYGYIVDDDGEFSVVSREQAVEIAKEDHVLRPGYENESRLQSYMVRCWRNRDKSAVASSRPLGRG